MSLEYIDVGVDRRSTAACRRQCSEVVCSRWRDDQPAFATAGKGAGWEEEKGKGGRC